MCQEHNNTRFTLPIAVRAFSSYRAGFTVVRQKPKSRETVCTMRVCMSLSFAIILAAIAGGRTLAKASSTPRFLSLMAEALKTHGVVPDVIDNVPKSVLQVTYPNNLTVEIGKELTPTQVKDKPTVVWDADSAAFYTLCMTDPDAPSRKEPKFREWHHWLVGNIPGNKVAEGEVLSDYIGSGPPPNTGLHRYVFLVYKQPGKLTFDEKRLTNKSGEGREKFAIRKFAATHKLGEPIAGTMYQAEYDDYVPILYKQLGA